MKLIVYTALFADPMLPIEEVGTLFPFQHDKGDVEYIAFTNRNDITSDFWDVRKMELRETSPRLDARYYKHMPHQVLPEHDATIWMDSQCYFRYEPKSIIEQYLDKTDSVVAMHHHSDIPNLAYESIAQAWMYKNDDPQIVMDQCVKYGKAGFPMLKYDHFETGIILRKNTSDVHMFNELWWNEIKAHSLRDQLSAPYVVWKCRNEGVKIHTIPESFTAHKHSLPIPKSNIFFTTPKPPLREDISKRINPKS